MVGSLREAAIAKGSWYSWGRRARVRGLELRKAGPGFLRIKLSLNKEATLLLSAFDLLNPNLALKIKIKIYLVMLESSHISECL